MMSHKKMPINQINWLLLMMIMAFGAACSPVLAKPTSTLLPPAASTASETLRLDLTFTQTIEPKKLTPQGTEWIVSGQTRPVEIVRGFFTAYLDGFEALVNSPRIQILDYRIESIEIDHRFPTCFKSLQGEFIAGIVYSVQVSQLEGSDWVAGSGSVGDDNWMNKKLVFMVVYQNGGSFWMELRNDIGEPVC